MQTFDEWFEDLKKVSEKYEWPTPDKESWRDYYDCGDTAEEAFLDMCSYAD